MTVKDLEQFFEKIEMEVIYGLSEINIKPDQFEENMLIIDNTKTEDINEIYERVIK